MQSMSHIVRQDLTWKDWCRRVPGALTSRFERDDPVDETDRLMKSIDEESWLFFDGYDSLISLRAFIEAFRGVVHERL